LICFPNYLYVFESLSWLHMGVAATVMRRSDQPKKESNRGPSA